MNQGINVPKTKNKMISCVTFMIYVNIVYAQELSAEHLAKNVLKRN